MGTAIDVDDETMEASKRQRANQLNFDYFVAIYLPSNFHLIYHLRDCPTASVPHLDYTLHEF